MGAVERNLALARADTRGMHAALFSPTTWHVRELELGLVHVERAIGGVRVRLEVYSGGGFVTSTAVTRVAGRVVSVVEAAWA